MTDHIITTTLTPAEQAEFESGRKIGWNEGIEAAAKDVEEYGSSFGGFDPETPADVASTIRALIKDQP